MPNRLMYPTVDEAGRVAAGYANALGKAEEGHDLRPPAPEYAGYIVSGKVSGVTKYAFTTPQKLGESGGHLNHMPGMPAAVGVYHSHGSFKIDNVQGDEQFSAADKSTCKTSGVLCYLATPFGKILKYDHLTGKTFQWYKGRWEAYDEHTGRCVNR
jgi:hypothetical protein